jgi:hypothetical protein
MSAQPAEVPAVANPPGPESSAAGPGTAFGRTDTRPHFSSRSAEHDAIDELVWEPGREEERAPLSPKKRADFHRQADERWNRLRELGEEGIRTRNANYVGAESRLAGEFESRADSLRAVLRHYQEGDFTAGQIEAVLADEEGILAGLQKSVQTFAAMEETALPDDTDPEDYFVKMEEERYRLMPSFKSRRRETEVDW